MNVVVTRSARKDFLDAIIFYKNNSSSVALKFQHVILEKIAKLEMDYKMYPLFVTNIYKIVITKFLYSIFYSIDEDKVAVLSIFHNRKKPINWD